MQIAERLSAEIDTLSRRTTDKARDLKVDARLPPAAIIAAREQQLGSVLSAVPAALMGCLHKAMAAASSEQQEIVLAPLSERLCAGYDALCKGLLQLPAPQLLKLNREHADAITHSRTRLKRLAREGRLQLLQRLLQQENKLKSAAEQRRAERRTAHEALRLAESRARNRARWIGLAMLLSIVTAMAGIWLRRWLD